MITGVAMVLLLLIFLYYKVNGSGKQKMRVILFWNFAVLGTWFYSSYQTGGLIDNRYANKDALGRENPVY
jgi:hypothetical protein